MIVINIKSILSGICIILSAVNANAAQDVLRTITLDSKNLKDLTIYEKPLKNGSISTLNIEFFNKDGRRQIVSGQVKIDSPYVELSSQSNDYELPIRDYSCRANSLSATDVVESTVTENCEFKRSFTINHKTNSDITLSYINDYLSSTQSGEIQEIAEGGVTINNNQSVHGGNTEATSGSNSAVLNNGATARGALAQAGSSSSLSSALASASVDNNQLKSTNIGVNTVKVCKQLVRVVRIQYKNNIIKNISLDAATKLISCPK